MRAPRGNLIYPCPSTQGDTHDYESPVPPGFPACRIAEAYGLELRRGTCAPTRRAGGTGPNALSLPRPSDAWMDERGAFVYSARADRRSHAGGRGRARNRIECCRFCTGRLRARNVGCAALRDAACCRPVEGRSPRGAVTRVSWRARHVRHDGLFRPAGYRQAEELARQS